MQQEPELVGYDEAARILGIAKDSLRTYVCRKLIPFYRLGPRLVRFRPDELRAWVAERKVEVVDHDRR